jgi:competence protein ComEC
MGGAGSVLKSLHVDTIMMASLTMDNHEVNTVLEIAQAMHTGIKIVRTGDRIFIDPSARGYVLHPDSNHLAEKNLNNSSVVLKIIYGNSSILLAGDAEVPAEQRLIPRYGAFLSSNVLKTGHHGSITSTSADFLNVTRPQTALISVGYHNKFRHPSPFTIWRMTMNSIEIQRTDTSGAIVLETDGTKWIQKEWR